LTNDYLLFPKNDSNIECNNKYAIVNIKLLIVVILQMYDRFL